jgi:uncharacterized coiled-coil protein SlyX
MRTAQLEHQVSKQQQQIAGLVEQVSAQQQSAANQVAGMHEQLQHLLQWQQSL